MHVGIRGQGCATHNVAQKRGEAVMPAPKFPQYKTVPTASLIPYVRNARTHSPAQVDKIAASIRDTYDEAHAAAVKFWREHTKEGRVAR